MRGDNSTNIHYAFLILFWVVCIFAPANSEVIQSLPYSHLNGNSFSRSILGPVFKDIENNKFNTVYNQKLPHKLNILPWEQIHRFLGASNFVRDVNLIPAQLQPRDKGLFVDYERGPTFQQASKFCVDSDFDSYSMKGLLCSGVINLGLSFMISSKEVQDTLFCIAAKEFTGNHLTCLAWTLLRHFYPDLIPQLAEREYPYLKQRFDYAERKS